MTKPPDIAGLMKALDNYIRDDALPRNGEFYHWRDGIMPAVRRLARAVEEATIERAAECTDTYRSTVFCTCGEVTSCTCGDELGNEIRALPRLTEKPDAD